jgi:hypothetical protein
VTDLGAATVDFGAFATPVQPGGFVLANVPEERWDELGDTAAVGRVLDASGETLRSGCIDWGPSPRDEGAGVARFGVWFASGEPCKPHARLAQPPVLARGSAEKLVELTLTADFSIWTSGDAIAVWRARTEDGWQCTFVAGVDPAQWSSRGLPGGGDCGPPGRRPQPRPDAFLESGFSSPGNVIRGHVNPASGFVWVELRSAAGSRELAFAHGYYLGQLPPGGEVGELPPGGPFSVLGYDAEGNEVASVEVRARPEMPTP